MGKKKSKKSSNPKEHICDQCRNFKARGSSRGYCKRKEKKCGAGEQACGHFEPA